MLILLLFCRLVTIFLAILFLFYDKIIIRIIYT